MKTKLFKLLLDIVADKDIYVDGSKYYFPNRTIEIMKKDISLNEHIEFHLTDIIEDMRKHGMGSYIKHKFEKFGDIGLTGKYALIKTSVILLDKLYGLNVNDFVGKYRYYYMSKGMLNPKYGELKVPLAVEAIEYITNKLRLVKDRIELRPFTQGELDELRTNHKFLQFIVPTDELDDKASTERNLIEDMSEDVFRNLKNKFMGDINNCLESNTKLDIGNLILKYDKGYNKNDIYMIFLFAVVEYIYGVDITVDELDEISIDCTVNDIFRDYNFIAEIATSKRSYGLYKQAFSYDYKALKLIVKALENIKLWQDKEHEDSNGGVWDTFCEEYGK